MYLMDDHLDPAAALGRLARRYERQPWGHHSHADQWRSSEVDFSEIALTIAAVRGCQTDLLNRMATQLLDVIATYDRTGEAPEDAEAFLSKASGRLVALDAIFDKIGYAGPSEAYKGGVKIAELYASSAPLSHTADQIRAFDSDALRGFADLMVPRAERATAAPSDKDIARGGTYRDLVLQVMSLMHEEAFNRFIEHDDMLVFSTAGAFRSLGASVLPGWEGVPTGQGVALAHDGGVRAGTVIGPYTYPSMIVKIPGTLACQQIPQSPSVSVPFAPFTLHGSRVTDPLLAESRLVDLLAFSRACEVVGRQTRGADARATGMLIRRLAQWSGTGAGTLARSLEFPAAQASEQILRVISDGPPNYDLDRHLFPQAFVPSYSRDSTAAQRTAAADFSTGHPQHRGGAAPPRRTAPPRSGPRPGPRRRPPD